MEIITGDTHDNDDDQMDDRDSARDPGQIWRSTCAGRQLVDGARYLVQSIRPAAPQHPSFVNSNPFILSPATRGVTLLLLEIDFMSNISHLTTPQRLPSQELL